MIGYLLIVLFFGALLIGFAVAWSRHSDDSGDGDNMVVLQADRRLGSRAHRADRARFVGDHTDE